MRKTSAGLLAALVPRRKAPSKKDFPDLARLNPMVIYSRRRPVWNRILLYEG